MKFRIIENYSSVNEYLIEAETQEKAEHMFNRGEYLCELTCKQPADRYDVSTDYEQLTDQQFDFLVKKQKDFEDKEATGGE